MCQCTNDTKQRPFNLSHPILLMRLFLKLWLTRIKYRIFSWDILYGATVNQQHAVSMAFYSSKYVMKDVSIVGDDEISICWNGLLAMARVKTTHWCVNDENWRFVLYSSCPLMFSLSLSNTWKHMIDTVCSLYCNFHLWLMQMLSIISAVWSSHYSHICTHTLSEKNVQNFHSFQTFPLIIVHCIHYPARTHTLPDCLGSIAWLSQSLSYSGSLDLRLWQPTCPWNLSASVASLVLLPVWTAFLLLFKSLPTQQVKTDFSEPALPSSSAHTSSTHVCYAYYKSDTDFVSKSEQRVAFQILHIWTLLLPKIKRIVCLTFTITTLSACYVPFYIFG